MQAGSLDKFQSDSEGVVTMSLLKFEDKLEARLLLSDTSAIVDNEEAPRCRAFICSCGLSWAGGEVDVVTTSFPTCKEGLEARLLLADASAIVDNEEVSDCRTCICSFRLSWARGNDAPLTLLLLLPS